MKSRLNLQQRKNSTIKDVLDKSRIPTTVRREMGRDINAACGQLRKSYIDDQNN